MIRTALNFYTFMTRTSVTLTNYTIILFWSQECLNFANLNLIVKRNQLTLPIPDNFYKDPVKMTQKELRSSSENSRVVGQPTNVPSQNSVFQPGDVQMPQLSMRGLSCVPSTAAMKSKSLHINYSWGGQNISL